MKKKLKIPNENDYFLSDRHETFKHSQLLRIKCIYLLCVKHNNYDCDRSNNNIYELGNNGNPIYTQIVRNDQIVHNTCIIFSCKIYRLGIRIRYRNIVMSAYRLRY